MSITKEILSQRPEEFVRMLDTMGIRRFYFVTEASSGRVVTSHTVLQPIADFIERDKRDYRRHEGMFFETLPEFGTIMGAFVHRTRRGQAAGGLRFWSYPTVEAFLRDGLRLAEGMTLKNSLAGLWWGGGKGVMTHNPDIDKHDNSVRRAVYSAYGAFATSLRGCYVTAEDVGTSVSDMQEVFKNTRYTTCIPPSQGGSGNPSIPTAKGVVAGMEAALDYLGEGNLDGKTVAVQGTGHVGSPLISFLFEKGVSRVIASDIQKDAVETARKKFSEYSIEVFLDDPENPRILREPCDILAPCAVGEVLNPESIPNIKARIVCGAANNQLADQKRDDEDLHRRGIVYVPDFLVNRMGIVTCADEQAGRLVHDPMIERHLQKDWEFSIFQSAQRVLQRSKQTGRPPGVIALEDAEKLSREIHPLYGHRGQLIIDDLVRSRWHEMD